MSIDGYKPTYESGHGGDLIRSQVGWEVDAAISTMDNKKDKELKALYGQQGEKATVELMDILDITLELEGRFGVEMSDEELKSLRTIGGLIDAVAAKVRELPEHQAKSA
jgi:hypothetical protein